MVCCIVSHSLNYLCTYSLCVDTDGWWRMEEIEGGGGGGGGRGERGGEKTLRRFLSLRVESSHERAAIYSGDEQVNNYSGHAK